MTIDQIRAQFEERFPLPAGVSWEGEHYAGSQTIMASWRNASEWDAMFRGYRAAIAPTEKVMRVRQVNPGCWICQGSGIYDGGSCPENNCLRMGS